MTANRRHAEIRDALAGRSLAWFGTRGIDALGIFPLGHVAWVTAQIAPIPEALLDGAQQDNLELRGRQRRDLDQYDIDGDPGLDACGLKTEFLARLDAPVVLVAYRAAELLCRPSFCHGDLVMAAPFHLLQRQFEYKPWVERELLERQTVPMLVSQFVRDDDIEAVRERLRKGPLVGRCSTGAGGSGVFAFATEEEYYERLPPHNDGFVGLTPLLDRATPLNVNACVYDSGAVATFGVSYQLIGVRGLTRRNFGFCGNDFGIAADLPADICDRIEQCTTTVGQWLHERGYRGIFGLDVLLDASGLFVNEINPRFQASTPLSSTINQALGYPDPMTEHVAAFLGLDAPPKVSVAVQTRAQTGLSGQVPVAQVIHRNISSHHLRVLGVEHDRVPEGIRIVGEPDPGIYVDREAMVYKSLHLKSVTTDGYSVANGVHALNDAVRIVVY